MQLTSILIGNIIANNPAHLNNVLSSDGKPFNGTYVMRLKKNIYTIYLLKVPLCHNAEF